MANFPQLTEDDFQKFDQALKELLAKSEASTILIVEKAGHLIHQCGSSHGGADQLATLAANSFAATQFMASLSDEPNFTGMFQQGEKISTLIMNIEEHCILVILFNSSLSVGLVKHYASSTIQRVADQIQIAQLRTPDVVFDLTDLNVTDASALFRKKEDSDSPPAEAPAESEPAPVETPAEPEPVAPVPEPEPGPAPMAMVEPAAEPEAESGSLEAGPKKPIVQTVLPGTYWWCACGLSKSQPFCDGSHQTTRMTPWEIDVTETRQIAWCVCKKSKNPPYCDGSHSKLA